MSGVSSSSQNFSRREAHAPTSSRSHPCQHLILAVLVGEAYAHFKVFSGFPAPSISPPSKAFFLVTLICDSHANQLQPGAPRRGPSTVVLGGRGAGVT